jgi:2-succinyl-5-enolpyruvyl-6-hydroxy-3-cyclohexene-1-carboxylate synthase
VNLCFIGEGKGCRKEVAEGEIIYTRTAEQFAYAEASPEYKECQKHMRQGIKNSQQCHKARILAETYDKMSVRIPEVNKVYIKGKIFLGNSKFIRTIDFY